MPELASEAFGVSHDELVATGAFDRFTDVDSQLYVDPHLLQESSTAEIDGAYKQFQEHFRGVFTLIQNVAQENDPIWKTAHKQLTFREIPNVGLGYSKNRSSGSAIGPELARELLHTASSIIKAGTNDPTIFELVGLLQDNIGPDRISDMTLSIILPHIFAFNQRVASQLGIPTAEVKVGNRNGLAPCSKSSGKPLLLVPHDILRDLPVSKSWTEFDVINVYNEDLRQRVSDIIGSTWKQATADSVGKEELRKLIISEPELLRDLLTQYKAKEATPYDFDSDPAGEQRWFLRAKGLPAEFPLNLGGINKATQENIHLVTKRICSQFKSLIEDNGLFRLLYSPTRKPLKERAAQLLFFGVADSYCRAANIDLSPESNAGHGPVDFKLSQGYSSRVNVETKLSTNSKLLHGWEKQLPIYDRAEKAYSSIFLVVRVHESMTSLNKLKEAVAKRMNAGERGPEVIVVDARWQESASKA